MFSTTKISSKGQVVIPEEIRKRLNIQEGTQFVVVGDKDVVVLQVIRAPDMDEFKVLVKQARLQAKQAGLKRSDINKAIKEVRGRS